jgi:ATP-dependent RNA helicase DDX18/HAS1
MEQLNFNHNKLLATESKLDRLVESSYHINRMAFYAYGSYMSYFAKNLLKNIFRTEQLNVNKVALAFGFRVPPRIKAGEAKFLS